MISKTGWINTVRGQITPSDLGLTLPHEHLFTDLRGPAVQGYAEADPGHVVSVIKPYLDEVADYGVCALVECSTIGVGRNPKILQELAENTNLHIIAPTGVYRDAYVPAGLRQKTASELAERWVQDITKGIDGTGVKAGFIKLAVSDEGISEIEVKNLEAAALTSKATRAIIACHTIGGNLALEVMNLLEGYGLDLNRFIWTHAQSEPDLNYAIQAANRGVMISIDAVGSGWVPDEEMLEYTLAMIAAGYSHNILLSHDAGWYDPSQSDGQPVEGGIRGYTALFETFLPTLRNRGVDEETIRHITTDNPAKAFMVSY